MKRSMDTLKTRRKIKDQNERTRLQKLWRKTI